MRTNTWPLVFVAGILCIILGGELFYHMWMRVITTLLYIYVTINVIRSYEVKAIIEENMRKLGETIEEQANQIRFYENLLRGLNTNKAKADTDGENTAVQ